FQEPIALRGLLPGSDAQQIGAADLLHAPEGAFDRIRRPAGVETRLTAPEMRGDLVDTVAAVGGHPNISHRARSDSEDSSGVRRNCAFTFSRVCIWPWM